MKLTLINHKITFSLIYLITLQISNFCLLHIDPNTFNKAKLKNWREKKRKRNKNTIKCTIIQMAHHKSVVSKRSRIRLIPLKGWRFKLRLFCEFRAPFITRAPHLPVHTTQTHILKSGTKEIVFWHICFCRLHTFTWEMYTSVYSKHTVMLQPVCTKIGVPISYCQLAEYMRFFSPFNKATDVSMRAMMWENMCLCVFWCAVCISGTIYGKLLKRHLNRGKYVSF